MSNKTEIFVTPVMGREIPDPERGDLLPAKGRVVVRNAYWVRRLSDGDVVKTDEAEKKKPSSMKVKERGEQG